MMTPRLTTRFSSMNHPQDPIRENKDLSWGLKTNRPLQARPLKDGIVRRKDRANPHDHQLGSVVTEAIRLAAKVRPTPEPAHPSNKRNKIPSPLESPKEDLGGNSDPEPGLASNRAAKVQLRIPVPLQEQNPVIFRRLTVCGNAPHRQRVCDPRMVRDGRGNRWTDAMASQLPERGRIAIPRDFANLVIGVVVGRVESRSSLSSDF